MMPVPALPVGQDLNDPATERHWIDWSPFSYPFNMTRQPAASIPCGLTGAGLPIGLQIVGPLYAEDRVLRAARAFEMTAVGPPSIHGRTEWVSRDALRPWHSSKAAPSAGTARRRDSDAANSGSRGSAAGTCRLH